MACNINNGKYYDNQGNESKLYKDLVEKVGEQEAHDLFVLVHTPTFKNQVKYKDEPTVEKVLKYTEDNFSLTEPLTQDEILDLSTLQLSNVETSEDLYDLLNDAFYEDNLFSPQINKLKKIYTETEIRNILENIEIQAKIKETVEKLRFTESFSITQVPKDIEYGYKEIITNSIGQYKAGIDKPTEGIEIGVVNQDGEVVETKLIYDNAVRQVEDEKIIDAVDAIISAPNNVDTGKVEKKVINWLKNYGLDITNLSREDYSQLKKFISTPTEENTIQLEKVLGFERSQKKEITKIDTPLYRSYLFLRTVKTEQQLFDELSLIKTNTQNVYHKVNKIDEEEMRKIMKNEDPSVPIYNLYKEYFEYNEGTIEGAKINTNIQTNIDYLTDEFVVDFAVEKIKKPNQFNELFKITENGIELINNDTLTITKIMSQIQNYPELADYSLISKILPNLKIAQKEFEDKTDRRINAVNNKESIPTPKSEITIVDDSFIKAPNEVEEFLRLNNDIFEQQEEGVYSKLEFQENPNYYTFEINSPEYKTFNEKLEKPTEIKIKKLIDKETELNNFDCL